MRKILLILSFILYPLSFAYAQIPECKVAIVATPPGPFPCSVTITWKEGAPNNETGFILERRLNGGPWAALGGTLVANTTSVVDATLQQSPTTANNYEYKVTAVNQGGQSPGTNPIMAGFAIPQLVVLPGSPTGITVTFKGAAGMFLCPTCTGGDRKVPMYNSEGSLDIDSDEITVAYKY